MPSMRVVAGQGRVWTGFESLKGDRLRGALTGVGTSLIRIRSPLGPFGGPMPRVIRGSLVGGRFLMGEVPLRVDLVRGLLSGR